MSALSVTCCCLLSAIGAFTLVSAAGCGTDAKGVDDCRDIEQARCSAAKSCGIVKTAADVDACQRFYRDQCLHGLAVSPPGSQQVKACVATIVAAGTCAAQTGDGSTQLSDCAAPVSANAPGAQTACEIVTKPELATECAFLAPSADAGSGGSSGASSAAGTAGVAGGAGASGSAGEGGG